MKLNPNYIEHARFARLLKRRAREMRSGLHRETHPMAMEMAAIHIRNLGRLLAQTQSRLEAAEAPRRKPAPFLRPAATVAALALGAATAAAILVQLP
jgi:hypothetical protein